MYIVYLLFSCRTGYKIVHKKFLGNIAGPVITKDGRKLVGIVSLGHEKIPDVCVSGMVLVIKIVFNFLYD